MKIIQLLPALHDGDAIGNNAMAMHRYFQSIGHESHIICLQKDADVPVSPTPVSGFPELNRPDSVTILHYALPSSLNQIFRAATGRRILVYHNITPVHQLRGYPHLQRISRIGREELAHLRDVPHRALGDSEFNRLELQEMDFTNTGVLPIYIDFDLFDIPVNPVLAEMFRGDFTNVLFVGRITPNKCQHDLLRLYAYYKRFVNRRCRLFLIGKWDGFESYYDHLVRMARQWHLGDVYIPGHVEFGELVTYYRLAHLFVSMSDHEGFGVPLVESMYFDLPILAYRAAAVPWTLGSSGVLFRNKTNMVELAELMHVLVTDTHVRDAVLKGQRHRLSDFSKSAVENLWEQEILGS